MQIRKPEGMMGKINSITVNVCCRNFEHLQLKIIPLTNLCLLEGFQFVRRIDLIRCIGLQWVPMYMTTLQIWDTEQNLNKM